MAEVARQLLEVRGLAKSYGGVHAVVNCDLTVSQGSVVGLIGPNGAGKSTVIDLISGFQSPDAGNIWFDGQQIQGWPAHRVSEAGLIRSFQTPREWKALTVTENVIAVARHEGQDALWRAFFNRAGLGALEEADRLRSRDLLEQFGLTGIRNERAGNLSGGQKRLLAFAQIAMVGAKVILLDEPLAGINPVMQDHILAAIQMLRAGGCTCVLIEHNLHWIERACDHVCVMALGRTIANGTMAQLRENTQVVDAYLGEVEVSPNV